MHKIDWCEGGLQLADIATKNVGEHDFTPRMKYIMVRLYNITAQAIILSSLAIIYFVLGVK